MDPNEMQMQMGQQNAGFDASTEAENPYEPPPPTNVDTESDLTKKTKAKGGRRGKPKTPVKERPTWDNPIEFLMSCIATSVGLGNVWRFPFVAYQNGGGAFLIPYLIVLIFIAIPMYYLETFLGQFSNSNCVTVWRLSPAMKGTGYAQALGACYVLSYYASIIALCFYYLAMSFQSTLPWAICQPGWEDCVPSGESTNISAIGGNAISSAELYFTRTVLRQSNGIHDGIGAPLWDLALCLLASWVIIFVIVARGVKSSGKASYFLALFPYIILFILLIRAVTLPGASKGILFFVTPQWEKILEIRVWYAALTQVFFSVSICSGALMMFASYNGFRTNVCRDSIIVTTLDTFTSLISGITIFGVLGNLAYELNYDDVGQVVGSGGTSLAFISYPDAIAKSPFVPQLFSVLFFLMMVVLGIGSSVATVSTINTLFLDTFPRLPTIVMSAGCCITFFFIGLVYVTPGGQYVLEIVDYYGGTFMRLFAAIVETIGVFWIYGLENLCIDIEFMLGMKTSFYWRICWAVITPIIMIIVFFYALITTEGLLFGGTYVYPDAAYAAGTVMQYSGIVLVPIFMLLAFYGNRSKSCTETVKKSFRKTETYGPSEPKLFEQWKAFRQEAKYDRNLQKKNYLHHVGLSLIGGYRRLKPTLKGGPKGGTKTPVKERTKWDNSIEFVMLSIATSLGLGNAWRFPFMAYQHGGGSFLIPYLIVLIFIAIPMYYLETFLGHFSNSNCVTVWRLSPAMKGTGYAQALGACYVLSYYVSIIALCFYYLAMSFQSTLPWAICQPGWEDCVPSGEFTNISASGGNATSSAELYFTRTVLRQSIGINDGIGVPIWDLALCLLASWVIIFVIVAQGVKSLGKASYFLTLFPYMIMVFLLIRAVSLPGATKGILFFITPQWNKILEIRVWYEALTHVFFSVSICSGALMMFASYNGFRKNAYRYSMIVTTLNTCTSLISGITIFGVLGNLAYELNYDDVGQVIGSGGTTLAFVSYPDAIAKSPFVPQLFSVLFFLMMVVLGIGSSVATVSTINTLFLDTFPRLPTIVMSAGCCIIFFFIGLVYVTPGGQYVLEIVDYYGGTFMRLFAAIMEIIGVFWIYGLENLCIDIEFMLGMKTSFYWRICWAIITPFITIFVFFYALITTEGLHFSCTYVNPDSAYAAGTVMQYSGIVLVLIFMLLAFYGNRSKSCTETVKKSFRKTETYGPSEPKLFEQWKTFRQEAKYDRELQKKNYLHHVGLSLIGGYRR